MPILKSVNAIDMASLNLSSTDLIKVRSSWADVMAKNHYKDDNFVKNAFSNLVVANPELKGTFADKAVYHEQQELFTELLKFTMTYLHDEKVLNECMGEFIGENPSLVAVGVEYLEPMGSVMIKTLRESLGPTQFHSGLETLWIKVYIYIANCILLSDVSDAESVCESTGSDEAIRPLNLNKPLPAPLDAPVSVAETASSSVIQIDIGGNEKYRGFRRSVTESPTTPVLVRVPASFASPYDTKTAARTSTARKSNTTTITATTNNVIDPSQGSFDPRPVRRRPSMEEPVLTPRSSRRNSLAQLQELGLDYDIKDASQVQTFDPRRRVSHKRNGSDMSLNMEVGERTVSGSSAESPVSDVDDEFRLEDQMDFSVAKPRSPVFDHNSFGIKGLAPIVESEHDEDHLYSDSASSNYAAPSDKTDDDYSSRTSSLSLHNLDYKSSISSGVGHLPVIDKAHKSTYSDVSLMAPLAAGPYPMLNRAFLSSVPSLSSRFSSGQRASLGFMRSSFILKKEMAELGYNEPENVVVPMARSMLNVASRSVASLPMHSVSRTDVSYKTELPSLPTEHLAAKKPHKQVAPKDTQKEVAPKDKKKSSLRKKFSSIFSSAPASAPPKKISAPISAPVPTPKASSNVSSVQPAKPAKKASRTSLSTSTTSTTVESHARAANRVSSLDLRLAPMKAPPSGYAASVYLKSTTHDNASIKSTASGKSGFSFFKSSKPAVKYHDDGRDQKVNKYYVLKVPYKTIYVKDLIR